MKKVLIVIGCICMIFIMASCSHAKSMDDRISHEQNVTGIVQEWTDNEVLVELQGNQHGDQSLCYVSLDVENTDSVMHFDVGDEIVIYYDGEIQETYPMQINTVYAITLQNPAIRTEVSSITIQEAEELALNDAGIDRKDIKYLNSYEEYKDHVPYSYEIEFGLRGDIEYHYSIEIETGEIIDQSIEKH